MDAGFVLSHLNKKRKKRKSTVKLDKFQMKEIEKECCANTYANLGDISSKSR